MIPPALKYWLYVAGFFGAWMRTLQNMKKWLVYGHNEQAINALKYFFLVIGPGCAAIYYESHNKTFKYCYWTFKGIGSCMKVVWDFYFDWGLFRRTKKDSPLFLRDKICYPQWFYYIAMTYDVFALFFWAVVIKYYYSMLGEHHELNVTEE